MFLNYSWVLIHDGKNSVSTGIKFRGVKNSEFSFVIYANIYLTVDVGYYTFLTGQGNFVPIPGVNMQVD